MANPDSDNIQIPPENSDPKPFQTMPRIVRPPGTWEQDLSRAAAVATGPILRRSRI